MPPGSPGICRRVLQIKFNTETAKILCFAEINQICLCFMDFDGVMMDLLFLDIVPEKITPAKFQPIFKNPILSYASFSLTIYNVLGPFLPHICT